MQRYHNYLSEIATLKEVAKIVIDDIDKGAWSMRLTVDVVKLHYTPEKNL
jgi:hypothetical protein